MLNDLNSILIEGKLKDDPQFSYDPHGALSCYFSIVSNRRHKVDDEYQTIPQTFDIVVFSEMADACRENLRKDRGVRVVGRLESNEDDGAIHVFIHAEHVEFKPETKKG